MGWMQDISCVLFPLSQDSLLSPFLVYQFRFLFDWGFVAAMIKNDDKGNKHKVSKDAGKICRKKWVNMRWIGY